MHIHNNSLRHLLASQTVSRVPAVGWTWCCQSNCQCVIPLMRKSYIPVLCTSYHMATRALANLSHEGANRCSSNSSVESLLPKRDQCFYGYQQTLFSLERTGEMRKRAASKAISLWAMMFSRQGTNQKHFFAARAGCCKSILPSLA